MIGQMVLEVDIKSFLVSKSLGYKILNAIGNGHFGIVWISIKDKFISLTLSVRFGKEKFWKENINHNMLP